MRTLHVVVDQSDPDAAASVSPLVIFLQCLAKGKSYFLDKVLGIDAYILLSPENFDFDEFPPKLTEGALGGAPPRPDRCHRPRAGRDRRCKIFYKNHKKGDIAEENEYLRLVHLLFLFVSFGALHGCHYRGDRLSTLN